MRKMIITINPHKIYSVMMRLMGMNLWEKMDHLEGKALLKMDFKKAMKIVVIDIIMKEGFTLEDLKWPKEAKILDVFEVKGNRHTCLLRVHAKKQMLPFYTKFDQNLIYDVPFYASKDRLTLSAIGDSKSLEKFVKVSKYLGDVIDIKVQKAIYQEYEVTNCLTEKQRELIVTAKKKGYYDYPRKITADELAKEVGLSKATTVEHLRKAEGRIVEQILAGY